MIVDVADVLSGVAEVGQVGSLRVEAVLVSRPGDGVGDSLPLVRVGAAHDVVARFGQVARVRGALATRLDAVGGLVPARWRDACHWPTHGEQGDSGRLFLFHIKSVTAGGQSIQDLATHSTYLRAFGIFVFSLAHSLPRWSHNTARFVTI